MTRNPLQTIGIAPEALQHTTLDQAARLVETMAKMRLRLEHPDAGGDAGRFQQITEAKRQLENREVLRQALQALKTPQRTKIAKLEATLQSTERAMRYANERAEAFMRAGAEASSEMTIYEPNLSLRLRDVLRATQVHTMHRAAQQQLFVTLTVESGQIVTSERGDKRKQRTNRLLGCLHQQDVPPEYSQAVEFVLARRPTATHNVLAGQSGAAQAATSTGNFLSWNRAEPLLPLLRPELRAGALIFSYRNSGEPGLLVEGQFLDAKTADPL